MGETTRSSRVSSCTRATRSSARGALHVAHEPAAAAHARGIAARARSTSVTKLGSPVSSSSTTAIAVRQADRDRPVRRASSPAARSRRVRRLARRPRPPPARRARCRRRSTAAARRRRARAPSAPARRRPARRRQVNSALRRLPAACGDSAVGTRCLRQLRASGPRAVRGPGCAQCARFPQRPARANGNRSPDPGYGSQRQRISRSVIRPSTGQRLTLPDICIRLG